MTCRRTVEATMRKQLSSFPLMLATDTWQDWRCFIICTAWYVPGRLTTLGVRNLLTLSRICFARCLTKSIIKITTSCGQILQTFSDVTLVDDI